MNILVTGGSGFIGQYLVKELLDHKYHVKILTRKEISEAENVEVIKGDITKPETLNEAFHNVDAVFHNAAYAADYGKKRMIYEVNVKGTYNVVKMCEKNNINRVVYTSSAGVYGFPNTGELITEDSAKKPMNPYQKSKLEGENIFLNHSNLKTSIIRPPLVLGAGGKGTEIILNNIKNGSMRFIGDGNNSISIVHPRDVAQCLRLALEKDDVGNTFNVVSFITTTKTLVKELAAALEVEMVEKHIPFFLAYTVAFLAEHFSSEPSLTRFRVKTLATDRKVSCEKAQEILGYQPSFDMTSTVNDMVTWYKTTQGSQSQ